MEQNLYRCSITSFFGSLVFFDVAAANKADALVKAREHARTNIQWGGNYNMNSVCVIKKIQKKSN